MKVLIVAGGTGGHFYPGLAVAQELISHHDDVCFVVRIQDKVIGFLERENIRFFTLHASGLKRQFSFQLLSGMFNNIRGIGNAFTILSQYKPDVVLAMGGYLSFPIGFACWLRRIP